MSGLLSRGFLQPESNKVMDSTPKWLFFKFVVNFVPFLMIVFINQSHLCPTLETRLMKPGPSLITSMIDNNKYFLSIHHNKPFL